VPTRRSRAKGNLYKLVKTVEFDVALGDDSFALRVELLQDTVRKQAFRANVWRNEFYRIQPTFPEHPKTGRPQHRPSDEVILIDWSSNIAGEYSEFEAPGPAVALKTVLKDIRGTLDRAAGDREWWR
jgi:hypothetical protein